MKKFENIADLAKAFSGLSSHFKKMAEHHGAMHKMHADLGKAHKDHADFAQSVHDGMDDSHEHKAYFGKVAALHKAKHVHHTTKADLHKSMAEHHAAMAADVDADDATKTAKVAPTGGKEGMEKEAGGKIEEMVQKTTENVMAKALETIQSSGAIEQLVEKIVLDRVNNALGNKVKPDDVHGALPTVPAFKLVARPGQLEKASETEEFPVELSHFAGE